MSRSLNKVMLIGNVGAEPEIRTTGSGTRLAKVSLATNRAFSDRSGQQQEKTEWHRLTFWDRLAEIVERYVHKGDRLYVEGRIEYSQTEDGGVTRYWTDVIVRDMVMLGSGGAGPDAASAAGSSWRGGAEASASPSPDTTFQPDDDLPF